MLTFFAELIKYEGGKEPETLKVTLVTNELNNLDKGEVAGLHHKNVKVTIEEINVPLSENET